MLLLLQNYSNIKTLYASSLIMYISLLLGLAYIHSTACLTMIIIDIYVYLILNQFKIISNSTENTHPQVKMEIVAEGNHKVKTTDVADVMMEYHDKFHS
jgi:hypothetical protein